MQDDIFSFCSTFHIDYIRQLADEFIAILGIANYHIIYTWFQVLKSNRSAFAGSTNSIEFSGGGEYNLKLPKSNGGNGIGNNRFCNGRQFDCNKKRFIRNF